MYFFNVFHISAGQRISKLSERKAKLTVFIEMTCCVLLYIHIVSDDVTDVVMSSLKTCNMHCGSHWEVRGRVGSKGWAVDHQPGMSVDGHSHHDHQKGDFQVSKKGWFITQRNGKRAQGEAKGKDWLTKQYS
jgi:hypothetical protein